jgi:hypothetical protein
MKKLLLCVGLLALFLPIGPVGCATKDPTIFSWPHHKRRIRTIFEQFHELHVDIDRIIFDMEEFPIEVEY